MGGKILWREGVFLAILESPHMRLQHATGFIPQLDASEANDEELSRLSRREIFVRECIREKGDIR
jgi:hypothetical protein